MYRGWLVADKLQSLCVNNQTSQKSPPLLVFFQLSLIAFLGMLFFRSGVFLWRIAYEIRQPIHAVQVYQGDACQPIPADLSNENCYRYQYARLEGGCD